MRILVYNYYYHVVVRLALSDPMRSAFQPLRAADRYWTFYNVVILRASLRAYWMFQYTGYILIVAQVGTPRCSIVDDRSSTRLLRQVVSFCCLDVPAKALRIVPNNTAYKRCSCHGGYKLLRKLCRNLPAMRTHCSS